MEPPTDCGRKTVAFAEVAWNVGFDGRCKSGGGCGTEVAPPTDFELGTVTFEEVPRTDFGRETVTFAEVPWDDGPIRMFCRIRTAAASTWFSFGLVRRVQRTQKVKKYNEKKRKKNLTPPLTLQRKNGNNRKEKNGNKR